ncbi:MAG: type II toxin-antitoxin system prevent-host-death family antitoxin [Streptomycetaceae bacterium]|nr:MAG: type II toxin-antitoxin system prevent-host-death family antitoxin [Streptomycetaceae bacterium]
MTTGTKKEKIAKPTSEVDLNPQVGIRELRQSASQILAKVKAGTVYEITDRGVPVARIIPLNASVYEEYLVAGLITPAQNPDWHFTLPTAKLKGKRTSTEILMEMRAEERY